MPWLLHAAAFLADTGCTAFSLAAAIAVTGGSYLSLLLALLPVRLLLLTLGRVHEVPPGRTGPTDLWRLYRLNALSSCAFAGFLLSPLFQEPVSVAGLEFAMGTLLMTGWRLACHRQRVRGGASGARTLILGAGDAGEMIAREMLRNASAGYHPVGFLDDDPSKRRQRIAGLPVLGVTGAVASVARATRAEGLVVAVPSATGDQLHRLIHLCRSVNLPFRLLPPLREIISGSAHLGQLRAVSVEDILGRTPVDFARDGERTTYAGKVALVTGGAGSIGSELCVQLWHEGVRALVVLDRSEADLFYLEHRLRQMRQGDSLVVRVADVGHRHVMRDALERYRPDYLFHAAAYKHVPLLERSPGAGVLNNVEATMVLLEEVVRVPPTAFVMLSTDKAARPVNILGATKRLCELLVAQEARSAPCSMSSVRFGNVLDSSGSVVALFRRQIAAGGPVTVTDPEASRYFMTIPEAVNLILHTPALGGRGEVFLLEMGQPVRILDLAYQMIRLSGLQPGRDIEVLFTGLRAGEKLHEQLLGPGEEMADTAQPMIRQAVPGSAPARLDPGQLAQLYRVAREGTPAEVIRSLRELVPEYTPAPPA